MTPVLSRLAFVAVLFVTTFFAGPARADAGVLVAAAQNCQERPLERPFLRWVDPMQYFLAPDGSFSGGGSGWSWSQAGVAAENQPWSAYSAQGPASLRLRAGGTATSPVVCVGLEHPTLRFFARSDGGLLSTLTVEVLFEDAAGQVHALPIGLVTPSTRWSPTLPMPVLANLLTLLPGERTPVAFRFRAHGGGWLIDDVYVDPYGKG